jgi:2-isopropylmalate synthase
MKPEVEIYDTTLRDGSQGEGINFSVLDKLRIAEKLDSFGVHYIEGGWPGSNPKDIEFFNEAKLKKFKRAKLAAFGSTRRKDVAVADDDQVRLLLDAETPVVTIFGKSWLLHVKKVLRTTADENLAMIADTVRFLKDNGKFVVYDAEHAFDGFKDNAEYALATWQAAEKAGADVIALCDTNGGSLPGEIAKINGTARAKLRVRLGIHTHDDAGLGVANALAALDTGASHVQGTINGYGERTGNCNLTKAACRHPRCRGSRSFRSSWMKSPTSATIRASRGSDRRRLRTRVARTSTPCKKLSAAMSMLIPRRSAIRAMCSSAI